MSWGGGLGRWVGRWCLHTAAAAASAASVAAAASAASVAAAVIQKSGFISRLDIKTLNAFATLGVCYPRQHRSSTGRSCSGDRRELCFGLDSAFEEAREGRQESNRPLTHTWIASCTLFPCLQEAFVVEDASEGGVRSKRNDARLRYRDAVLAGGVSHGDAIVLIAADGPWEEEDLQRLSLSFRCMASKTLKPGALCVSSWKRRIANPRDEELTFEEACAFSIVLDLRPQKVARCLDQRREGGAK